MLTISLLYMVIYKPKPVCSRPKETLLKEIRRLLLLRLKQKDYGRFSDPVASKSSDLKQVCKWSSAVATFFSVHVSFSFLTTIACIAGTSIYQQFPPFYWTVRPPIMLICQEESMGGGKRNAYMATMKFQFLEWTCKADQQTIVSVLPAPYRYVWVVEGNQTTWRKFTQTLFGDCPYFCKGVLSFTLWFKIVDHYNVMYAKEPHMFLIVCIEPALFIFVW